MLVEAGRNALQEVSTLKIESPQPRSMLTSANSPTRLLIADDQRDVLEALRLLLKAEGYSIETASSPGAVMDALRSREYDVLLIDLNYARVTIFGQDGLD